VRPSAPRTVSRVLETPNDRLPCWLFACPTLGAPVSLTSPERVLILEKVHNGHERKICLRLSD
jgi:hypothetical protein